MRPTQTRYNRFKFATLTLTLALNGLFSSSALAVDQGVTLNLDTVRLYDLVKVVYGDSLAAGFAVDTDLLTDKHQVALDVRNLNKTELRKLLDGILQDHGFRVQKTGSFFTVKKLKPGEEATEPFYYQPKYRSVAYITDMLQGLFKGRFTFQGRGGVKMPETGGGNVEDSGTTAYSQGQKNHDAFVFLGAPLEIELLQKMLEQVDTPAGEVLVKAYLYEVTTSEKEGSGFTAAVNLLSGKFGLNIAGTNFANSLSVSLNNIQAVFSAFENDSRFKVISSPSLRVHDGSKARFSVGAEVPVLGAITTNTNGQLTQSVEYRNSGTILDISPTIRADMIELIVSQQISNFIPTTTGVNNSPTLIKRELSSKVSAKSGDLILMGGLDELRHTQDSTGLSWLPSFLHSRSAEQSKNDILLVLHVQRL